MGYRVGFWIDFEKVIKFGVVNKVLVLMVIINFDEVSKSEDFSLFFKYYW